jgi:cytoskeletal protein CcmA (bactofilin family)
MTTTQYDGAAGEIHALLGKGTEFQGKLTFEGRVRIDGVFSGEIFSDGVLVLGESAEVRAEVEVGSLVVNGGSLWGNVRAKQLIEARAPARIVGNIEAPQLVIDKGVVFEGQCTMTSAAAVPADAPVTSVTSATSASNNVTASSASAQVALATSSASPASSGIA